MGADNGGTRVRRGRVSRRLGQLERSPTSVMTAGASTVRTMKASIGGPWRGPKVSAQELTPGGVDELAVVSVEPA